MKLAIWLGVGAVLWFILQGDSGVLRRRRRSS